MVKPKELVVAIGGLGAIGRKVALALDAGIPGLRLGAVSARDAARAAAFVAGLKQPVPVLPLGELGRAADIVLECAPAAVFRDVAVPALEQGRTLVAISVGALLSNADLKALAERHGGRIVVPSGAMLGLDALQAAAQGEIHSVTMKTRKPPAGLEGAPHLVKNNIRLDNLKEPLRVFEGTAREAVLGFPANVNVAAAVSLAGIGPDRTRIEIWADPGEKKNVHSVHVVADSAEFTVTIAGVPSENPKTGRITALSVIAALRKLTGPLVIGT